MRKTKPFYGSLGTVSHGTMRAEDLIPRFLDACDDIRLTKTERATVRAISKRNEMEPDENTSAEDLSEYQDEQDEDVRELFDILDAHAPAFCYFGAHEGDGADYGFWISRDSLEEAEHDGAVTREDRPMPAGARYRLDVSDHGNMTLYHRNGREVWSVV